MLLRIFNFCPPQGEKCPPRTLIFTNKGFCPATEGIKSMSQQRKSRCHYPATSMLLQEHVHQRSRLLIIEDDALPVCPRNL